jgi:hypothetical protein
MTPEVKKKYRTRFNLSTVANLVGLKPDTFAEWEPKFWGDKWDFNPRVDFHLS